MKLIIAGCAKNCGKYLNRVLEFIDSLRAYFPESRVIFAYDNSTDNTFALLKGYKDRLPATVDLLMCANNHKHRTVKIAGARNCIMTRIATTYADYDTLCFLDMDDIVNGVLKPETLDTVMSLSWDAISFNRVFYYDIWALRFDPYLCSCWGFGTSHEICGRMGEEIRGKLKGLTETEVLPVKSAFNGIAFFRLDKFLTSRFTGLYEADPDFNNTFGIPYNPSQDDCDWVSFYHDARKVHPDLKVMISPLRLY
jgi:hypothetical protein